MNNDAYQLKGQNTFFFFFISLIDILHLVFI